MKVRNNLRVSSAPLQRWMLCRVFALAIVPAVMVGVPAHGAINWDGEAGTHWWFNPVNWNTNSNVNTALPPSNGSGGSTDAQINISAGDWNQGEGVVYDPDNDPHFDDADDLTFPPDFHREKIYRLYMARNTPETSVLTIKSGTLETNEIVIVGRSSGIEDVGTTGKIVQTGGTFRVESNLDLGNTDTSNPGYGNGIYDYRGGVFELAQNFTGRLRLAHGGSAGTGGEGRFIMHNPTTGGYVRPYDVDVSSNSNSSDGITRGIGVMEFHYQNGATRPMQINNDLRLNNGVDDDGGIRSSRLELVLDEAPIVDGEGIPNNLGLFDVDFDNDGIGSIIGAGDNSNQFSSIDGMALYEQGTMVSAMFGADTYNWTISYTGNITWSDADNSVVDMISESGGRDIVLIGHSSMISAGLAGDYNGDGTVDAADYTVWRDNLGSGNLLNEGASPGVVDEADYAFWKSQFGTTSGSASALGVAGVPEPGTLALTMVAVGLLIALRRRAG